MVQLPQADVFCSSSLALLDSLQDDALQVLVVDGSKVTSEEEVAVLRREAQMGVTVILQPCRRAL